MSSSTSEEQETPTVTPRQIMRGHTSWVRGVVHLPGGRRTITCSSDSSLRVWDLESGTQIGNDWRDEGDGAAVYAIALSPNGNTVASGSVDGTVRLWDIETGKVIAKWTEHTGSVQSVCWSANSAKIASGSEDGTVIVWDVESGVIILGPIETDHQNVWAVIYSPDETKIATGGHNEDAVQIWDAKTGELLDTLKHDWIVCSLAWTSDGKKLVAGSYCSIRIFDTVTSQEVAILEGHTNYVNAISLSRNNCLLASASDDGIARLWNLETNLPVGPPLQHEGGVRCAPFSVDGKVLVTGCEDKNAYVWDVYAILGQAGLQDLLSNPNVAAGNLLMDTAQAESSQLPPGSVNATHDGVHSSATHSIHSRSSVHRRGALAPSLGTPRTFINRLSSLFHRSDSDTDGAIELQQRPREQSQDQAQAKSSQTQPAAASTSATPPALDTSTTTSGPAVTQSRPVPLWARFVHFLCCASPPHVDGH